MAQDLNSIIKTGNCAFHFKQETCQWEMYLEYEPSTLQLSTPSSMVIVKPLEDAGKVRQEIWNSEQIGDFVRKLGFVDKDKEKGGGNITLFLYFYQARQK